MKTNSPAPPANSVWYDPSPDHYDESWSQDGALKPHWHQFISTLSQQGNEQLPRLRDRASQFLRENGVTYNVYGEPDGLNRPWELDPIPLLIDQAEWAGIETGLLQRVRLFDLILQDLYGPRTLIRNGLLPLEMIYSHRGFLRACDQIRLPGPHQLVIHGVEMARGPDQRMWILGDRTQAPSGAGYALENRMAMTHILPAQFRDFHVRRHAGFFRALRNGLAALATHNRDDPNVVILTPGPHNETYFEHAYLAAYLGYTLVQGNDLTVREGQVWLKALDGLKPVDVILRRVDDDYCDPLELRENSQLGVAGLLEAARRGNVSIANPLGSGLLENPALLAFLPNLSRQLLGEDLQLPSVATWWCGQPKECEHVLKNLPHLVIKPTYRHRAARPIFGAHLTRKAQESLRVRIRAQPHLYVGQEVVSFSTVPALIEERILPRHAVMRGFVVASGEDYVVMPGGLTRSAVGEHELNVSNQAGGISKDTWILAPEAEKPISLWQQTGRGAPAIKRNILSSRAADDLFWVGRQAERAEIYARTLRTVLQKYIEVLEFRDEYDTACLPHLLRALTHVTNTYPGFVSDDSQLLQNPETELLALLFDPDRSGSISHTLNIFVRTAYAARELWSSDSWRLVDEIDSQWNSKNTPQDTRLSHAEDRLDHLIMALMAFSGLSSESIPREQGWRFLDMGRRIERSQLTGSLLRATLTNQHSAEVEHKLLEAVLLSCESLISYRRRYRTFLQLPGTLELLMFDPANPRAMLYQFNCLQNHIAKLPRQDAQSQYSQEERLVLEAITQLKLTDPIQLTTLADNSSYYQELDQRLARCAHLLTQLAEVVTENYFSHTLGPQQLSPTQPDIES